MTTDYRGPSKNQIEWSVEFNAYKAFQQYQKVSTELVEILRISHYLPAAQLLLGLVGLVYLNWLVLKQWRRRPT